MNLYWDILTWLVPAWLLAFGVGETYAGVTGRKMYTTRIREYLGIAPAEPKRVWLMPTFALVIGGFAAWFLPHIELGIWPS